MYPVLDHLFDRYHMGQRVNIVWHKTIEEETVVCSCVTRECNCDMYVTITDTPHSWTINREKNKIKRTNEEMYLELVTYITSKLSYYRGYLIHREVQSDKMAIMTRGTYSRHGNFRKIKPFINYLAIHKDSKIVKVPPPMLRAMQGYSFEFYRQHIAKYLVRPEYFSLNRMQTEVWKRSAPPNIIKGVPWDPKKEVKYREKHLDAKICEINGEIDYNMSNLIPSLQVLCMRQLQWYNMMYTGNTNGPYTFKTNDNLYSQGKIIQSIDNLDQRTKDDPIEKHLGMFSAKALDDMYDYMGIKKQFGMHSWSHIQVLDALRNNKIRMKQRTSAGIRAGPEMVYDNMIEGIKCHVGPNGMKAEQLGNANKYIIGVIMDILGGRDTKQIIEEWSDRAVKSSLKGEHKNVFYVPFPEQPLKMKKGRTFYIPSTMVTMLDWIMHGYRQKLERGKMIKVGMRWRKGGAYHFAKQLRYDDPEMVYGDGDFKNFDTTIKAKLLLMYNMAASLYVSFTDTEEGDKDKKVYEALLEISGELLAHNIVHVWDKLYLQLIGTMLSGKIQTSNGDSWIVGFLFFMFVQHLKFKYPKFAAMYERERRAGRVHIPIYGDDHNIAVPRCLHPWLNENNFRRYCEQVWHMYIRDVRNDVPFFSEYDEMGELKKDKTGVVFLKRYMFRLPEHFKRYPGWEKCAPVVPGRPMRDIVQRVTYGVNDRETLLDNLLSIIGLAYDNMGVNLVAHQFLENMYAAISVSAGICAEYTVKQAYEDGMMNAKNVRKMIIKSNIPTEKFLEGFPTMEYLVQQHYYDERYHNVTYEAQDLYPFFPVL